jgi:hypothetical protein
VVVVVVMVFGSSRMCERMLFKLRTANGPKGISELQSSNKSNSTPDTRAPNRKSSSRVPIMCHIRKDTSAS